MKKIKITRQEAIYRITLAAISTALSLLFVGLSVLVDLTTVAFFIAAGLSLMVPIIRKYYSAAIFSYVATSILSFFIAGDLGKVIGFVAYFGPMSIFLAICVIKKVKWYIQYPIKIIYINGALALMYYVFNTIFIDPSILGEIPYYAIAIVGTILLLVLDLCMQFIFKGMIPIMDKVLRKKDGANEKDIIVNQDDDLNAFEGDSPFSEGLFEDENKPLIFPKEEKKEEKNVAEEKPDGSEKEDQSELPSENDK